MNQSEMEGRGLPTLYPSPSGDPNRVGIKMNDPAIKTYTGSHLYVTQPNMSEETIALLSQFNSKKKASSKSTVIDYFGIANKGPAQHVAAQAETGTKRPHKGIIGYSVETLIAGDPDPSLHYVHPPHRFASGLPPPMSYEELKAAGAAIEANLAAATAKIEARSARYLAAAPAIPRYWEDPSKKKASEAAATSTEGQAEAGGPVPKRACQDPNPSADSSATGSRNN